MKAVLTWLRRGYWLVAGRPLPKRLLTVAIILLAGCNVEWRQAVNWSPDAPWAHVPLTVDATAMPPEFEESVREAEHAWNHASGCDLLVPARGQPADVIISPYDGTACGALATLDQHLDATAGTWRCSPTSAEVHFRVMSDIRSVFVIAEHEAGHVLGLAHDRSELMNATPALYEPQQLSGNSGLMPLPSDRDASALHARYCK